MFFLMVCSFQPWRVCAQKKTSEKEKKPVFIYKEEEKQDPYKKAYEETLKLMHGKKDTLVDSSKLGIADGKPAAKGKNKTEEKKFVKAGEACECVTFKTLSQDSLERNVYITYRFQLRNNCKEGVWVNTSSFGYHVFNPDGRPTRVLHKLSFVKRYNYPEFVMLPPESEYEFKFADDAFFEYDLHRALKYEFRYYFNNTSKKASLNGLNYLCVKEGKQVVYIK